MSVEIHSTAAPAVDLCTIENCDSKPYKNSYCVEHYVQYGESNGSVQHKSAKSIDNGTDGLMTNTEEEKTDSTAASSDPTATIQPAMAQVNFANILPASAITPKNGSGSGNTGSGSGSDNSSGDSNNSMESPTSKAAALKAKFAKFGMSLYAILLCITLHLSLSLFIPWYTYTCTC
jgi:hypothetical protein